MMILPLPDSDSPEVREAAHRLGSHYPSDLPHDLLPTRSNPAARDANEPDATELESIDLTVLETLMVRQPVTVRQLAALTGLRPRSSKRYSTLCAKRAWWCV